MLCSEKRNITVHFWAIQNFKDLSQLAQLRQVFFDLLAIDAPYVYFEPRL